MFSVKNKIFPVRIAVLWALVLIAMVVYAFAWFSMMWFIWPFIDAFEAAVTLDPPFDTTVTIIKNAIAWNPVIALAGWIIYGYINSSRRGVRSYEEY